MKRRSLLLGALGLGVAAGVVYAVTRKKETVAAALPGAERPALVYQKSPLHLRQGSRYRARLVATAQSLPPFALASNDEDVGKAFGQLGFQNVRVFSKVAELPTGWPAHEVEASEGTKWIEGTWGLPTSDLARPSAVLAMWQTRST